MSTESPYDATDPIHVLQKSIEVGWLVTSIPKVYYGGTFSSSASPKTAPDKTSDYCVLDFGDAAKQTRTNMGVIWEVPVTVKVYDIAMKELRVKVSSLMAYLGLGEHALADSKLVIIGGSLSGVVCGRVTYGQVDENKAKAEFEMRFRLVLPLR